jgi:hypothetical protein
MFWLLLIEHLIARLWPRFISLYYATFTEKKLNFGITATDQIIDTIIFLCSVFFLSHNYGEARFG